MLSSGVPRIGDYERLGSEPEFEPLLEYSREFQSKVGSADGTFRSYGARWVADPFLQWSRRWEYVYVLQRLESWWEQNPVALDVADAGSGFTFFPFFLKQRHPDVRVRCIDADPLAGRAIREATRILGKGPSFASGNLVNLDQASESLDAVFSVSVIEHTTDPLRVVEEIHRVLRPHGLFVCTFDVSFESRSPMHVPHVDRLLQRLRELFDEQGQTETDIIESAERPDIVTTSWASREFPDRLPWRFPRLVWLYDALRGRFRSSLYRPLTFYCGTFVKISE